MRPRYAAFAAWMLCLLLAPLQPAYADWLQIPTHTSFNLFFNSDNDHATVYCQGGLTDGMTTLDPIRYVGLQSDNSSTLSALRDQRPDNREDPAAAMVYQYLAASANLTGDFYIDLYRPFDRESGGTCLHGADIVAYYDYGSPTESALGLSWIQLYEETGGAIHSPGLTVDGVSNRTPAYYPPGYVPWKPPSYTFRTGYDLTWSDGPQDPHPESENWQGGVDFSIYLAGFSTPTYDYQAMVWVQQITLYDGVSWGYDGICAPEPSGVWLLIIGVAALAIRSHFLTLDR